MDNDRHGLSLGRVSGMDIEQWLPRIRLLLPGNYRGIARIQEFEEYHKVIQIRAAFPHHSKSEKLCWHDDYDINGKCNLTLNETKWFRAIHQFQWIFWWSSSGIIVLIILIIALQDIILIEEDGGVEGRP